jgi:lipopolysaccharide heptosyltransferase II
MSSSWIGCKKVLCIRPDNMGDLIMTAPALRALKESFGCSITLLTSSMAAGIVPFLPEVDDCIVFNAPWVKLNEESHSKIFNELVEKLKGKQFDAAIVFTVFSQNPLPSVMIAYLAGIPKRLAYCRENPYSLLTHWVPDKEPYCFIQHQVERDLELVETIGAQVQDKRLHLKLTKNVWQKAEQKLESIGINLQKPWLLFHPGVSERKREYPQSLWIEAASQVVKDLDYQVILTGNAAERNRIEILKAGVGSNCFNAAGLLTLEEFITLINRSALVVSVNTSTVHIAAAMNTPVIVLYALTNPQHSPWMAKGKVLLYDVPPELKSNNQILHFVTENRHPKSVPMVSPGEIVQSIRDVLICDGDCFIPAMIPLQTIEQVF